MTVEIYDEENLKFVDITPYIFRQGFKWQRQDADGQNAGRTLETAYMWRDRIAIKHRLDVTCRPLKFEEAHLILRLIKPEYVTVRYSDPEEGEIVVREMYSNNIPAAFELRMLNGVEYWSGIAFPLIER